MKIIEIFAIRLRDLIDEKELSLHKLEKEININHTTMSRWLNGKTMPQAEYLCSIADYFNCSIDYLLGREM